MGGGKTTGCLGTGVPQRVQGRSPGRESGDEVPQKLKNFLKVFTSKFYAFLVAFNTFSPIYAYVFPCMQASFH